MINAHLEQKVMIQITMNNVDLKTLKNEERYLRGLSVETRRCIPTVLEILTQIVPEDEE